ncbi:uncharacterized protein PHACADRAFT_260193 [Phanerochaete carnosa HHB-10118-sp]|uniref:Uncharacterized protein n=1 Tax=Phanerochaete carnosa (strain HHB-10118-sp) TaxID=650164 RepID=K5UUL5_PHACS|nr:uncharacterized protein PHACADRAFT_260193 [Phanerochaete carnosa HHB-10118-sp]EKM53706.1 hypothetical protein PHACADRAFT_260193 [Phanerochaete carnosa HHB-10118-sp]
MLKVFTSCCLCLCTAIFALFVAGLIRARAQSRSNPLHQRYGQMSPWAMLREERVQFVVPLWVAQVIDSSTKLAANRISGFTAVGITCYIVIIVSGGRAYQHMVNHSDVCPMTRVPCLITSVVRSSKSRPKGGDLTDGSPVVRLSQERQHSQLFGCPHQHRRTSTSTSKCVTRHDVIELEMLNSLDRLPSAASGDTAKHPVTDESASSAEVRSVLKDADASLSP